MGLTPNVHRLSSLGHDPVLGRVFGVNGYDLRHLATMTISPAVAETIVRTYDAIRTPRDDGDGGKSDIRARLKLSKMLVLTHGLLASSNILKTALCGWNPTAMNIAQFGALAKQMLSLLKCTAERDALVQERLAAGWKAILTESASAPHSSFST